MLKFVHAEKIVQTVLESLFGDKAVILQEKTLTKPYGWVFFYQGRRWVETRKMRDAIIGGGPFLVHRFKPELRHITGAGTDLVKWLAEYEASLNPHDLTASPEYPPQERAVAVDDPALE